MCKSAILLFSFPPFPSSCISYFTSFEVYSIFSFLSDFSGLSRNRISQQLPSCSFASESFPETVECQISLFLFPAFLLFIYFSLSSFPLILIFSRHLSKIISSPSFFFAHSPFPLLFTYFKIIFYR